MKTYKQNNTSKTMVTQKELDMALKNNVVTNYEGIQNYPQGYQPTVEVIDFRRGVPGQGRISPASKKQIQDYQKQQVYNQAVENYRRLQNIQASQEARTGNIADYNRMKKAGAFVQSKVARAGQLAGNISKMRVGKRGPSGKIKVKPHQASSVIWKFGGQYQKGEGKGTVGRPRMSYRHHSPFSGKSIPATQYYAEIRMIKRQQQNVAERINQARQQAFARQGVPPNQLNQVQMQNLQRQFAQQGITPNIYKPQSLPQQIVNSIKQFVSPRQPQNYPQRIPPSQVPQKSLLDVWFG